MEAVWALTALWLGPFALPLYARAGRPRTAKWQTEHTTDPELGLATEAASGRLAGGAASLIGHVVAIPFVLATGLTLFGVGMFAMIAVIAVLAIAMRQGSRDASVKTPSSGSAARRWRSSPSRRHLWRWRRADRARPPAPAKARRRSRALGPWRSREMTELTTARTASQA